MPKFCYLTEVKTESDRLGNWPTVTEENEESNLEGEFLSSQF